jgi:hypothetical protein
VDIAKRIMWILVGGLCGWLVSLAPLIGVNALAYTVAVSPGLIPIMGAVGLLLAIALGGLTAGLLGGRSGGVWNSALAGLLAAMLFAGSLIVLINTLSARHELPYLLVYHAIRTRVAIGFIACLLLAVAAGVGAIFARRERIAEETKRSRPRRPSDPAPQPYTRSGMGDAGRPPVRGSQPTPGYRGPRERAPYEAERHSREGTPRW